MEPLFGLVGALVAVPAGHCDVLVRHRCFEPRVVKAAKALHFGKVKIIASRHAIVKDALK